MSDELQKPPVVDLDALLQPISEENPAGENLRYSGLYDQITEARRADDNLNQGDWQTEIKVSDFRRVIDLGIPALTNQSKDLQIAAWVSEALVKEYGFAGLRDSLKLLSGLEDKFWETLHPEIDEGDMEGRANAIAFVDMQASFAVLGVPFTGGDGYSYIDWEDSKTFDIPENLETLDTADQTRYRELKEQAEKERRTTGDLWRKAIAATRRRQCEEANFAVEECWAAVKELDRVNEERYDRNQMPGLSNLKKSLEKVHTQITKVLEEKRLEEPDEVEAEAGEVAADGSAVAAGGTPASSGAIQSRKDALKRLGEIADFFARTEPHSPVSYLVSRAVKWGNMPLESWLQDVIKDETVLYQLRQTLGINTSESSGNSEYQ